MLGQMCIWSPFLIFILGNSALVPGLAAKYPVSDWKSLVTASDLGSHNWDFDFDDKNDHQIVGIEKGPEKDLQPWTENDLCKNLQCKPHQMCLVEDDDVAVCISKRKYKAKMSKPLVNKVKSIPEETPEDTSWQKTEETEVPNPKHETEKDCIPCPVVKPDFVCGSDNHTYSSVCRLEFRNCMHKAAVHISCKGFCPCKAFKTDADHNKETQMKDRWNRYMNKYQNTVSKPTPVQKNTKRVNTAPIKNDKPSIPRLNSLPPKANLVHDSAKNSVISGIKDVNPIIQKGCTETELKTMGDRLLDWFSVVMADHRRGQSRRRSFRLSHTELPDCKAEVSWMFQHLDTDGDLKLSLQELYDLENDDREHCLRPYLLDCDIERDLVLSPFEWCSCFDKSQRPCASALRRIPQGLVGGYTPSCDGDGYYMPTQCHNGSGTCWCVDRHGVEFTNTRRRGRPDCEGLLQKGQYRYASDRNEDQEEDSSEEEGSADRPLDF